MAAITPVVSNISDDGSVLRITWETLTTTNDTGTAVSLPKYWDKTVTVTGTFGAGGTISIQGSNDGANWFDLTDFQGVDIELTAAGLKPIAENPLYIRPYVSAGDGTTDLDVILIARLSNTLRT